MRLFGAMFLVSFGAVRRWHLGPFEK